MKLILLSDTHLKYNFSEMPSGDVLCHAGDGLNSGSQKDWYKFKSKLELAKQQYKHVLYTPGNHDHWVEDNTSLVREELNQIGVTLLVDEEVTIDGKRFYGSPWTPRFGPWAYMKSRGDAMADVWKKIPSGLDVLITHGPPMGILDWVPRDEHVGCWDLKHKLLTMEQPPKLMVFGHIHVDYGNPTTFKHPDIETLFINASICDDYYSPVNPPQVYEV